VTNIEITDGNIKSFERVARKYGVNYALKKDVSGEHPRYLVFFKAKDTDALTAAFKEYAAKEIKREKKPRFRSRCRSIRQK
jgi:chemotaxis receptor (MCP) glutamine deamidase CheD